MKKINITVDAAGLCTLSDDSAGSCGEHNNLTLTIKLDSSFFQNCEYYKLNIDGRYSESLTASGGSLSYTVPQAALCPPEISCQVVGFKTVNEKSVLICRTKTFKLKVEPSPGAYLSINTDVFEPLEAAIAQCGNAVSVAEEQIAELQEMGEALAARAGEVESAASGAAADAKTYAQSAQAAKEAAAVSAGNAGSLVSSAQNYATAAESSAQAAAASAAEAAKVSETISEEIAAATESLTTEISALKTRVQVDTSGLWGGRVNKIFRELYLDFSGSTASYTAQSINKIVIGRNVNGEWTVTLGKTASQTALITFRESSERYDVITAENAEGVRAYAVVDWAELEEGATATFQGITLNLADRIGAWPIIYNYLLGGGSGGGTGGGNGADGFSPIVNITPIENGNRIEITDAAGTETFEILNGENGQNGQNGADGVSITKVEKLTSEGNIDIYGVYFSNGTYTPISITNGADGYTPQKGTDYFTEEDKNAMVAEIIEILGEHTVFGYVDENNNIMVSGNLADGEYTVKYEMADGSTADIGSLVLDTAVYYSVSNNLTSCISSNSATEVMGGRSYSATISANDGYTLSSVMVTMGGADITASAVSGGNISIANVTGDIAITALADQTITTPENLADPTSSDWLQASRYSVSSQTINNDATDTTHITNYIPVNKGDVISFDSTVYFTSNTYGQFAGNENKEKLLIAQVSNGGDYWSFENNTVTVLHDDVKFMRFTLINVSDKTAVTIKLNDTTV